VISRITLVKYSRIILINLAVFVLLFFALELTVRIYHVVFEDGAFFRSNKFISPWITSYDYPPPMIDDEGRAFFRHETESTSMAKPDDTIRIIAVGGSTTVNKRTFAAQGIDYPAVLESLLNREPAEHRFEVLNAGGDAFSTAHSLVNISLRLIEYEPDIILLMHNINDSTVSLFGESVSPDYSNKYLLPHYVNPRLQVSSSLYGFLYQSRLLAKLGLPQKLAQSRGGFNVDNDSEFLLRLFKRNLKHIANICTSNNIDIVLLTQPNSMKEHETIDQESFLEFNRAIKEVAETEGVHHVDMFAEMGHDENLFEGLIHYTPEGIRKFANILHPRIRAIARERMKL